MNETAYAPLLIIIEILFVLRVLKTLCNARAKKSMLAIIGLVFAVWLATLYTLISKGFFSGTGVPQISFSLGVVIPVLIGYLAIRFTSLKEAVAAMTTKDFLRLQYWRSAFGVMFFLTASLPMWFKLVGGLGDIAAGIGAFLALAYFRHHPDQERQTILRGNLVGILDFMIVFPLGVGIVLQNQSPDIMFDLIPLYVVPVFILLHIFSLMRLREAGRTS